MAKFCGNCGAKMDDGAIVCGMCGTKFADMQQQCKDPFRHDLEDENIKRNVFVKNASTETENKKRLIVSLLALLNIMFSPIFDVWGGLFPGEPDSNFWDVISGQCDPDEWVFILTMVIAIPSFLMFAFALAKKPRATKVSGWIGIVGIGFMIVSYINQFDFSALFDFDDGNLCFGFWIGLALFIVMANMPTKNRTVIK